jgi:hypothetical protein
MSIFDSIIAESERMRSRLFGDDAELQLYTSQDAPGNPKHRLRSGFLPNQSGAQWSVDLWCLDRSDIQACSIAKLIALGQTLTFKLKDVEPQIIGGNRLRIPMQMIGDQA